MLEPIQIQKNHEREFRIYHDRFSKRSLRPQEYVLNNSGQPYVPPLGYERLKNEAACLEFVRQNTNVPVPDVLGAYEDDGSFVLVTELLPGVRMDELSLTDQAVVKQEIEEHIRTLQQLSSHRIGGPSGIICPPRRVTEYYPKNYSWPSIETSKADFVFCHCDLSQSNIIVNPETLKIEGIIDWEHGGFWPTYFETPFFRDSRPSGAQFKEELANSPLIDFFK